MWPGDALPQRGVTNWQVFYATRTAGAGANTDWQAYMKPPGASMIYILMLAAGAGGSRVANGSVTQGGGGGGSGGMSRMLIPAALLPDIIYVRPGRGGLGATTNNDLGAAGSASYVSIAPLATSSSVIFSQAGAAQAANTQAAGPAGAIGAIADNAFSSLGLWFSIAGQAGTAGSSTANANASSVTAGASGIITSGGSGGGCGSGKGGNISGGGFFPTLNQSAGANGAAGFHGFQKGLAIGPGLKSFPLIFTGACGGNGVTTAATAGKGGDASYGGGGGGGGSGTNAGSNSGDGGNGGDALVIIGAL